jgi:hypothetical protein
VKKCKKQLSNINRDSDVYYIHTETFYRTVMNMPQVHSIYNTETPKWSLRANDGSLGQRVSRWDEKALERDSLPR